MMTDPVNNEDLLAEVAQVSGSARLLHDGSEISAAYDRMATAIEAQIGSSNPLVLSAMIGGLIPTGHLLTRLRFPLQLDYVHASRYQGKTAGGELHWLRHPQIPLRDRVILIVDDVLDLGITLQELVAACHREGARAVYTAVLVEKDIAGRPGLAHADFTGIKSSNEYLYGHGMDYKTYLRNADGIYAVAVT